MQALRIFFLLPLSILALAPTRAGADTEGPPSEDRLIGIGYKVGNGIGFLGADIFITPVPHLTLDLHAAYMTGFDSAFALAPAIQAHLFAGDRSTPYAGVGLQYARATLGRATAEAFGFFANLGYEWKWSSGLGVQLGGGVQVLRKAEASDGDQRVTLGGQVNPNLELGLRYRFP